MKHIKTGIFIFFLLAGVSLFGACTLEEVEELIDQVEAIITQAPTGEAFLWDTPTPTVRATSTPKPTATNPAIATSTPRPTNTPMGTGNTPTTAPATATPTPEAAVTSAPGLTPVANSATDKIPKKSDAATPDFKALAQKCSQDYDVSRVIKLIVDTLITDDMTDVEKIKMIHDYLILTTTYDHVNISAGTASNSVYNTYGCIIGHRCVCQGYAYAFMDIMTYLGIDCVELSGGHHAWNAVKVGDYWYYIDLTWDDPYDGGRSKPSKNVFYEFDYPHYNYFLVTEEFLTKNHTLDKAYNSDYKLTDLPECFDDTFMNVEWERP